MSELLSENCTVFDIDAAEKQDVLMAPMKELHAASKTTDVNESFEDVLTREAIAPTYVGFDMGLPHGKTDHMLEAPMCFGGTKNLIAWTGDGEAIDLVIMIAVPLSEAGNTRMKILAGLSRKLMHEEFRELLRNSSKGQIFAILAEVLEG